MYYQPTTQEFFATHSEIRIALNVSFSDAITDAQLADFGIYPIIHTTPVYDPITQNATETYPAQDEKTGLWMQQWIITSATPEEIVARQEAARASNKTQAVQLMQETDWVELPSVSDSTINPHLLNKADFITYRAELRAIALNPPVETPEWPQLPTEQWSTNS